MKWKVKIFMAATALLLLLSSQTLAADSVRVNLNGREIGFDVPPQMIHDRTMVPVRAVFEAMGAEVEWLADTQTARAVKGERIVEMTVGNAYAVIDGSCAAIDAPPMIIDDRILVSARFAAEGFGYRVQWDGLSAMVTLSDSELLSARFFDVGQADSELVTFPDGRTLLIDAGGDIRDFLRQLGISRIDYLVATHPHSDHIAYLDEVIREYEIGQIYMPKISHTSRDFENLMEAAKEKGLTIQAAQNGVQILSEDGLRVLFLSPGAEQYDNLNDYSAVIKVVYGDGAMLFMGDAQVSAEAQITGDVSAEVLKVGHHGSDTSTSQMFLQRVSPSYGVISCGAFNAYGHPSDEVLKRLAGIRLYRTDLDGTVTMLADRKGINGIYTQKEERVVNTAKPVQTFYRTRTGSKYHVNGCRSLEKSRIPVSEEEIARLGLTPCGICIGA